MSPRGGRSPSHLERRSLTVHPASVNSRRKRARCPESRPLAFFAGLWTRWTSVRKVKEGETTNDLFGFLTTEPNAEIKAIHPKAMPVIPTTPTEVDTWLTAGPRGAGPPTAAS